MRNVIGVVVGYVIFALPAAALFQVSGHDPHAAVSTRFMVSSIVCGLVFAVGAVVSMLTSPATEARWSQWSAILLMAPSALIGGRMATRSPRR